METEKEKELWKIAKKRVGFRKHLATYIIVNAMFWALWWFTDKDDDSSFPWPVWPMLGWGIGIAFDFIALLLLDIYASIKLKAIPIPHSSIRQIGQRKELSSSLSVNHQRAQNMAFTMM